MATIKAGTYTMKEVLTLPSAELEIINFSSISIGSMTTLPSQVFVLSDNIRVWAGETVVYFYQGGKWTDSSYMTWVVTADIEETDAVVDWFTSNLYVAPALKYIHLYREDNLPYKIYQAETDADMDILKNDEEADGCIVEFIGTSASGTYEQGRFYTCERDVTLPTFIIYASDYYHSCEYEGKEYQYEEGMTWGEWLTSDYNVDGWEDDGQSYVTPHPGTYYVVRNTSSVWVTLSDIISDDQYWCYEM